MVVIIYQMLLIMHLFTYLELKAEIEKLKAAQRNSRNIDPERYRLCRQEITSLRMKLHQQERDIAEMQRWNIANILDVCVLPEIIGWVVLGLVEREDFRKDLWLCFHTFCMNRGVHPRPSYFKYS